MIRIYCIPGIVQFEITNLVKAVSNSGDSSTIARKLTLTLAHPIWDSNQPLLSIPAGTKIWMTLDDEEIFRGIVWTPDDSSDEELTITAYDYLIYLNKSKVTHNFTNIMPENATKTICSDLGIQTGNIAVTNKKVSRLLSQVTGCDAIMQMYDQVKANGFLLTITGIKLNVIQKGLLIANYILTINNTNDGNNMISNSYTPTLEGMVNKVKIYDANGKYLSSVENTADKNKYGTLQENYTAEDGKNSTVEAKKLLKGIEETYSEEAIGNWLCRTGFLINAKIFYIDSMKDVKLLIDGDTHTWDVETNKYTMQLNLVTN